MATPFTYRPRHRGVTLVEVIVAMVIISMVMGGVLVSLRTGMQAYREGAAQSEILQTARALVDIFSRDVRSIFYRSRFEYNKEYEKLMAQRRQAIARRETQGPPDAAFDNADWEDPLEFNPIRYMHKIDLVFRGGANQLSFVRFQPSQGIMATQPWALARLTYDWDSGSKRLIRTEESVFAEHVPMDTYETNSIQSIARPDTKLKEAVAENISDFKLSFGYFHAGEWLQSPQWNSNGHDHRNPHIDLGPAVPVEEMTPEEQRARNYNNTMPPDDLPAYVLIEFEVTVTVGDADSRRRFQHLIHIAPSTETYIPLMPEFQEGGFVRKEPRRK